MLNTPDQTKTSRLLDRVISRMRVKHYSLRIETSYVEWIKRYIRHHGKRHPKDMGLRKSRHF